MMGNSNSALGTCLLAAVNNNPLLVSTPQTPLYQLINVHPYNLDHKVTPVAVTYPQTSQQVAAIVQCAAKNNVKVQPRGGGHSYANYCLGGVDGAVVVDLKNIQQFSHDSSTQHARMGGGLLLQDVDKQLNPYKRAIAHGTCPQVGLGGHATIGGLGPASRMWGTTLDHVVGATVVLANGTIATASTTTNPDLFFAIKGAGAGFGIVTEFEVLTHPQPGQMVEYEYGFDWGSSTDLADAFGKWQTLVSAPTLDRRFASQFIVTPVGAIISGTFFGTKADFDQMNLTAIFPNHSNASEVVFDDWLAATTNWAESAAVQLGGGVPNSFYAQNLPFKTGVALSPAAIKSMFEYIENTNKDTPAWFVIFDLAGGAVNDPPLTSTAYSLRDINFYMQSYAIGLLGISETTKNFLRGLTNNIKNSLPGVTFGAYPGYVDPELGDGAQAAYWGANLPRLQQIKTSLDPNQVFFNPQSVRPVNA